jgi:hypothetical protein
MLRTLCHFHQHEGLHDAREVDKVKMVAHAASLQCHIHVNDIL